MSKFKKLLVKKVLVKIIKKKFDGYKDVFNHYSMETLKG